MDDSDAALMAILATAYAARMRKAGRPEWLVRAFLRLVRAMRGSLLGGVGRLFSALGVKVAVRALATSITRYVDLQVPSAPAGNPLAVARDFQDALTQAVKSAQQDVQGNALARRLAVIVPAETQLLTARLTKDAADSPGVGSITRTAQPTACDFCVELAGTYTPPYPDDLWDTHPHCACSWEES